LRSRRMRRLQRSTESEWMKRRGEERRCLDTLSQTRSLFSGIVGGGEGRKKQEVRREWRRGEECRWQKIEDTLYTVRCYQPRYWYFPFHCTKDSQRARILDRGGWRYTGHRPDGYGEGGTTQTGSRGYMPCPYKPGGEGGTPWIGGIPGSTRLTPPPCFSEPCDG
jgi:hypothetical protein